MPFTASHAVVALPFLRTPLVPAAIAIGAMAPDLPLFLRGTPLRYGFTHSPAHIVWTALLAFALFLLWRVLLRPAVPQLVPRWLRRRLPSAWGMPPGAAVREAVGVGGPRGYPWMLALSLVLGVLTHIAWDAFTHRGRWGVRAFPALAEAWGPLPGHTWLQHASSLLGLVVVGLWAIFWLARRPPQPAAERFVPRGVVAAWALSLPGILALAWALGHAARGPFTAAFTPQHLAYAVLPQAGGVWGLLTLALCLAVVLAGRRRSGAEGPAGRGKRS